MTSGWQLWGKQESKHPDPILPPLARPLLPLPGSIGTSRDGTHGANHSGPLAKTTGGGEDLTGKGGTPAQSGKTEAAAADKLGCWGKRRLNTDE